MKKITVVTKKPRAVMTIKPMSCSELAARIKRGERWEVAPETIPAEWVPVSIERPPRNAWIVFMNKDGYADVAHEWRDEHHLECATHWLRGYPGATEAA